MESEEYINCHKEFEILTSKKLRLLPLYNVITDIYEMIVSAASQGNLFVDFSIDYLLDKIKHRLVTEQNRNCILDELPLLFPDLNIYENGSNNQGYILWRASWEEEMENNKAQMEIEVEDLVLSIQESLQDTKQKESLQKTQQKCKKRYK